MIYRDLIISLIDDVADPEMLELIYRFAARILGKRR